MIDYEVSKKLAGTSCCVESGARTEVPMADRICTFPLAHSRESPKE
jgi:hypothetical protein